MSTEIIGKIEETLIYFFPNLRANFFSRPVATESRHAISSATPPVPVTATAATADEAIIVEGPDEVIETDPVVHMTQVIINLN